MKPARKLFLGARLRRLRRDLKLKQVDMASRLGISASYLNHLERNQRPVTATVLLRLAEAFDINVRQFAAEGGELAGPDQLAEIFSDALFADLDIGRQDILDLSDHSPGIAEAIGRLYTTLTETARRQSPSDTSDPRSLITPETWVRDHIQAHRNHFPALAEAAETVGGALANRLTMIDSLCHRLRDAFGVGVEIASSAELGGATQSYDRSRRTLFLNALLRPENRAFGLAYQLSLLEFDAILTRMVREAGPPDDGVGRLLHMSLANYAAGAILMPYGRFLESAEREGYALDPLCGEYNVNVEQVAHRLTTMGRAGSEGVPFFMLRVDPAGNVSKRYAGESFPFSHYGGTCPRWHLHLAFQTPGKTITQLIETPDGERYFTFCRTIERPIRPTLTDDHLLAIGIGCHVRHAPRLAYAKGLDLNNGMATPVGPACAICPRLDCAYRATPPAGHQLAIDETRKTISPYPFLAN